MDLSIPGMLVLAPAEDWEGCMLAAGPAVAPELDVFSGGFNGNILVTGTASIGTLDSDRGARRGDHVWFSSKRDCTVSRADICWPMGKSQSVVKYINIDMAVRIQSVIMYLPTPNDPS